MAGLKVAGGIAQPGNRLPPAVLQRGRGDQTPDEVVPPGCKRREVGGTLVRQRRSPAAVSLAARQHRLGVRQAARVPAGPGPHFVSAVNRLAAVLTTDRVQQRVEDQRPARGQERRLHHRVEPLRLPRAGQRHQPVRHALGRLLERVGSVVAEQRGEHASLAARREHDLGVAGHQVLGAPDSDVRALTVGADGGDVGLQAERHRLDPRRADLGGRALALPRREQRLVEVGAKTPYIRKLQLDQRRGRPDAGLVGELKRLRQLAERAELKHVQRAELVHSPDAPDAQVLFVGDLPDPLERCARKALVPRALPAADGLQRLEADIGRPAGHARRVGRSQRPAGQRLSQVQLTGGQGTARGNGIDPAGQFDVVELVRHRRGRRQMARGHGQVVLRPGARRLEPDQRLAARVRAGGPQPPDEVISERCQVLGVPGHRQGAREDLVDLDREHRPGQLRLRQQFPRVIKGDDRASDGAVMQSPAPGGQQQPGRRDSLPGGRVELGRELAPAVGQPRMGILDGRGGRSRPGGQIGGQQARDDRAPGEAVSKAECARLGRNGLDQLHLTGPLQRVEGRGLRHPRDRWQQRPVELAAEDRGRHDHIRDDRTQHRQAPAHRAYDRLGHAGGNVAVDMPATIITRELT